MEGLRCKLNICFLVLKVYRLTNELYSDKEDNHAATSGISFTLYLEARVLLNHHCFPKTALVEALLNIRISLEVIQMAE